jgi:hypothetical protein
MWKLDPVPEHCKRETAETKPKVEANARRAVFDNAIQTKIQIIDVDCWMRESDGLKADHIVSKMEIVDIVVELKGKDILHAIDQIVATSEKWRNTS